MKLILCSGQTRREGWKTLDANPKNEPDFLAVIPPLPSEVKAVVWDEIELVHGITSFYPWEAETLLKELREVLSPGSKLVLEQPDLRKASHKVEWLFGDPSARNPLHMNRWAYDPESLLAALALAGFKRVDILTARHHEPARDFRAEAYVA